MTKPRALTELERYHIKEQRKLHAVMRGELKPANNNSVAEFDLLNVPEDAFLSLGYFGTRREG